MDTYQRFCPIHREPLVAVPPVNAYPHKADEPWCAPELHCESGTHLVGKACDVDSWLVVHVPSGLILYEANEDGARRVNSNVLIVEPSDFEERPETVDRVDARVADPSNWVARNMKDRSAA